MRERFAKWLIRTGYRILPARNIAGVVVNLRGKWQAIKL